SRTLRRFGGDDFLHFLKFKIRLLRSPRAQKSGISCFFPAASQQPAGRLSDHEAADDEQYPRRQRYPENAAPSRVLKSEQPGGIAELRHLVYAKAEVHADQRRDDDACG